MTALEVEHELTIWMVNDVPARMMYAGRRWRITDTPTRIRDSIWSAMDARQPLYGWRFQATDMTGESFVFDVHRDDGRWHVHRAYS